VESKAKDDDGSGSDSDAESFSDEELETGMDSLMSVYTSSDNKEKKKKKDSKPRKVHHKTDVNVFKLDLSTVAQDGTIMTGDPVHCVGCTAVLNAFSKIVTEEPAKVATLNAGKSSKRYLLLLFSFFLF